MLIRSPDLPEAVAPEIERAWRAVVERDPAFDGVVFYGVQTTSIYCRPSCPAKRPRRSNVRFFPSADAAEAAGFRACKRCRPGADPRSTIPTSVERARHYLDSHLDEPVTLAALSRIAGSSPFHLQRTFKRHVGLTPRAYQAARRMERLKQRLRYGDTVSRATYEAGFGSSRAVYEKAGAALGMSPGAYRRGGRDVRIRYAVRETGFGWLMIAASSEAVCAVHLGDRREDTVAELEREYPQAEITCQPEALDPWLSAIAEYLEGTRSDLPVPTELSGTDFQLRVWRALQEIPFGATRSYREVAESIGQPGATRAVARACAANRIALLVPCHRVVRTDGRPGGYRWGEERKRELLRHEGSGRVPDRA